MPIESMSHRDMLFWIFLTLFGTGSYVIFDQRAFWGTALMVIGLIGMIICALPHIALWGIALMAAAGLVGISWVLICRKRRIRHDAEKAAKPSFEIIFDPKNPGHQFWSSKIDSSKNLGIEYRVQVWNKTDKTIHKVKATSERLGPMGALPTSLVFDLTEETTFTLDPNAKAFVRLFFVMTPIRQPGMLSGDSAEGYGPIKVTVSALNTPALEKLFTFNPFKEPMIF